MIYFYVGIAGVLLIIAIGFITHEWFMKDLYKL